MLVTVSFSLESVLRQQCRRRKVASEGEEVRGTTQSRFVLQQWRALIYTISVAYDRRGGER